MARLPYIIPYDPHFLEEGFHVPLPVPCSKEFLVNNGEPLDYIHFSLVLHKERQTALYTAHNLDMAQKKVVIRRDNWSFDPRIKKAYQIGEEGYKKNPYDKGHLVRRDAVAWGTAEEAQDASDASFYFSNAALQLDRFNRNREKWLGLEEWVMKRVGVSATRLCVFTGPIFTDVDEYWKTYRAPAAFWKIIVLRNPLKDGLELAAVAFLMKQNPKWGKALSRMLDPAPYQVPIAAIEGYTGLQFEDIRAMDEFQYRKIHSRSLQSPNEIPINDPTDILFSDGKKRASSRSSPPSSRSDKPQITPDIPSLNLIPGADVS